MASSIKIMFRMEKGNSIRDGSGNYACPNLYCWREFSTAIKPYTTHCPNCNIELDWNWID